MQTNGIAHCFNVQSILMLTHLQSPDMVSRQGKRREEPDSEGFSSVLAKHLTAKAAAN